MEEDLTGVPPSRVSPLPPEEEGARRRGGVLVAIASSRVKPGGRISDGAATCFFFFFLGGGKLHRYPVGNSAAAVDLMRANVSFISNSSASRSEGSPAKSLEIVVASCTLVGMVVGSTGEERWVVVVVVARTPLAGVAFHGEASGAGVEGNTVSEETSERNNTVGPAMAPGSLFPPFHSGGGGGERPSRSCSDNGRVRVVADIIASPFPSGEVGRIETTPPVPASTASGEVEATTTTPAVAAAVGSLGEKKFGHPPFASAEEEVGKEGGPFSFVLCLLSQELG